MATISSFGQVLTFKVQTVTIANFTPGSNGEYGPAHVLAIWVTKADASNTFVKTIDRHAVTRVQYLTNWIASTPTKNVVDATTGSTLNSHPTSPVTYTWNCTDVNKAIVKDGSYNLNIEFTEGDATGKFMRYPFTIGPASTTAVSDVTTDPGKFFKGVNISLTQSTQTAVKETTIAPVYDINYLPNAKLVEVKYDVEKHSNVVAQVFDSKGTKVSEQYLQGSTSVILDNLTKGTYVIKVKDAEGLIATKKFVSK